MTALLCDGRRVAVLFCARDSVYFRLPVDCFDERRDARTYRGLGPVIAHPPCRLWSALSVFSTAPEEERALAFFALAQVRRVGGVLEHPAFSKFWSAAGLPLPGEGCDGFGGWTLRVKQRWWGHPAEKRTWLYIRGVGPDSLPGYSITGLGSRAPRAVGRDLSCRQASATPLAFAWWLEELAGRCGDVLNGRPLAILNGDQVATLNGARGADLNGDQVMSLNAAPGADLNAELAGV